MARKWPEKMSSPQSQSLRIKTSHTVANISGSCASCCNYPYQYSPPVGMARKHINSKDRPVDKNQIWLHLGIVLNMTPCHMTASNKDVYLLVSSKNFPPGAHWFLVRFPNLWNNHLPLGLGTISSHLEALSSFWIQARKNKGREVRRISPAFPALNGAQVTERQLKAFSVEHLE